MKEILIAKFGTKCVVNGEAIDQDRVNGHAERYSRLMPDFRLGIVSSGSLGAGNRKVRSHRPDLANKLDDRTLAAIGSSSAFHTWQSGFNVLQYQDLPIVAAELKATHDNMDDADEGKSLVEVFLDCVNNGIVPVFNINDPLDRHKDELGKIAEGKDNDHAAAHLALKVCASTLMLLTARVDGVLIDGVVLPTISVSEVEGIQSHLVGTDEDGTGSMGSKIQAGIKAIQGGVPHVFIGNSNSDPRQILSGYEGTHLVL